jgi:hypothetical protein
MIHYICTGDCGGESDKPGVCLADGCSKEDQPLVDCNCADGLHAEVIASHAGGKDDFVDEDLPDDQ